MNNFFFKNFNNKKVLITGHTGFKGSWLSLWMHLLKAKVLGISNKHLTKPNHYQFLGLNTKIKEKFLDIRDLNKLKKTVRNFKPDFIFHLAAQSIVSNSYDNPIKTWTTNTIGTVNLLESLKEIKNNCSVIIITSDKSYKNIEINRGFIENDILGGFDPYSASKASAELAISSYFKSFLEKKKNVSLCIARAGNVIGGGDWTKNRLIPDCVRSVHLHKSVIIRNPDSTRPWQHVLEALGGYMLLAINLKKNKSLNGEPFNFGPGPKNNFSVLSVFKKSKIFWEKINWMIKKENLF